MALRDNEKDIELKKRSRVPYLCFSLSPNAKHLSGWGLFHMGRARSQKMVLELRPTRLPCISVY